MRPKPWLIYLAVLFAHSPEDTHFHHLTSLVSLFFSMAHHWHNYRILFPDHELLSDIYMTIDRLKRSFGYLWGWFILQWKCLRPLGTIINSYKEILIESVLVTLLVSRKLLQIYSNLTHCIIWYGNWMQLYSIFPEGCESHLVPMKYFSWCTFPNPLSFYANNNRLPDSCRYNVQLFHNRSGLYVFFHSNMYSFNLFQLSI